MNGTSVSLNTEEMPDFLSDAECGYFPERRTLNLTSSR